MRTIVMVVALLVSAFCQDVGGQAKPTSDEELKKTLTTLDKFEPWIPTGPKDQACRAFWRWSSYDLRQKEFNRRKVKDPALKKVLAEKVKAAREKATELLTEKAKSGEALGCGGRELSDSEIMELVGSPPKKSSPTRVAGKK